MRETTTDHPNWDALQAFGQGRLAPEDACSVEEHLALCRTCCDRMADTPADSFLVRLRAAGSTTPGVETPADTPADAPAVPPELVQNPRYRVLGLVGRGGMGAVYRAEHRRMERLVALKVIHPRLTSRPEAVERFRQEVRAAARLAHPNIVTAHDADQAGGLHFLVMEYIEGTSLAERVDEGGPLPVADACDYVRQAALGLQHAHEQGLVHRDIKPHNLMLTPEGRVKILDFGLARLSREAETLAEGGVPGGSLTGTGTVMGTADYIAPEQAANSRAADIRADIYSLGCTLFHLLTREVPFPAGTVAEKVARHGGTPLPPVKGIPAGLAAVLARMTAKAPAGRFATPAEVAQALAPFCRTKSSSRLRMMLACAAVVLAAGLVPVALSLRGVAPDRPGEEPIERPSSAAVRVEDAREAEKRAIRVVTDRKGWVRRDEAIPGHPVVLVSLAGTKVTDPDLAAVAAFGQLGTLDLANTSVSDAGLKHLAGLKRLQKLVLVGTKVTDEGMKSLGGLRPLEELELQLTGIGDDGIRHLAGLTGLRRLYLHCTKITDGAMPDIGKMKGLISLTLGQTHVTDEGLKCLPGLPKLTQLGLFFTWRVGDEGMKSVARLESLQMVDLCGTRVTDEGLKHLSGCTKLNSIRVAQVKVTDRGLRALAGMTGLEYLDLGRTEITDIGMGEVARHRRLIGLDLRGASKVTDAGVAKLAGLPELDSLVLSGTGVTDVGLGELARCPRLRFIGLLKTAGVTADGVNRLRAARPKLQIQR